VGRRLSGRGGSGEEDGGAWLPLTAAAPLVGVPSAEALRRRIRRGSCPYPSRRSNAGAWEVLVPDGLTGRVEPDVPAPAPDAAAAELAALRATVAAQARHIDDLRRELERRRWPGLVPWLRRALWG
jgi:hypothetical protein